MTGPDNSTTTSLFESIAESLDLEDHLVLVTLSSGQSPNLKAALKCINQCAASQNLDFRDETLFNEAKVSKRRSQLMS